MKGRRIVFESVGSAVLRECAVPEPGEGEVLLENEYTVVSAGTELACLKGMPNTATAEHGFPHHPGYSASGRVAALGRGVAGFSEGDRVVVNWGGHRSHTVKRAEDLLKIEDESVSMRDAAFAPIASFSFLGVRALRIEMGEPAAIAGQGLLGLIALQAALLSGAVPAVVSDLDPARRALALRLGASRAFSPGEDGFVEKVREATGGARPAAVVEVTGSAAALRQALEYISFGGRISLLGCTRVSDVPIDFYKYVHRRGVSLIGTHTHARPRQESRPGRWTELDDYRAFLRFLAAGRIRVEPLVSEVAAPERASEVYGRLLRETTPPLGVVFDWRSTR